MKNDKPVLPVGTIISYLDNEATVIEDGPEKIRVLCNGNEEIWEWECYGETCEIVHIPGEDEGMI